MSTLSPTARVILGLVALGAPHGIRREAHHRRSTRFFWGASYGQIYPELRRLEARGPRRGARGASRATSLGGCIRITPAGERAVREWLLGEETAFELRDEGLLRLFFARPARAGRRCSTSSRRGASGSSSPPRCSAGSARTLDVAGRRGAPLRHRADGMERRLVRATRERLSQAELHGEPPAGGNPGRSRSARRAISEQSGWCPTVATGPSAPASASRSVVERRARRERGSTRSGAPVAPGDRARRSAARAGAGSRARRPAAPRARRAAHRARAPAASRRRSARAARRDRPALPRRVGRGRPARGAIVVGCRDLRPA